MQQLDQLFRFLLIVAAMEKNRMLKSGALWDAYHYWFRMVASTPQLRAYAHLHFPLLDEFVVKNQKKIDQYERRSAASLARDSPAEVDTT